MSKMIDLTGQTFGYWKVISRAPNDSRGRTKWNCICTACGAEKEVSGSHLRGGRSTNCGCVRMEKMRQASIKDETGKIYGFLQVNRQATQAEKPRQDRTGVYWNCTCLKCGKENVIVFGDYLRKGETASCGCINSKNESNIAFLLDLENIQYIKQYYFSNLFSNKKQDKLYFDIAVFENAKLKYIIEYDGIQHFKMGHFNDTLIKTHRNDSLKNKYCFEHNIPLIRIPYNSEYNINDLKLETTRFLLTPENEKIYYINNGYIES